jgi:hypothetical protein
MQTVEDLIALEEIKQLKARYFYTMDTKDWAGYAGTFTDDAEVDFSSQQDLTAQGETQSEMLDTESWTFTGGAAVAAWLEPVLGAVTSVHHGHDPQITLMGPDTATGIWPMTDRLETTDEVFLGFGHYREEYRRVDGEWLISKLVLTRLLGVWERHNIVRLPTSAAALA